jgi:hypothetical protein
MAFWDTVNTLGNGVDRTYNFITLGVGDRSRDMATNGVTVGGVAHVVGGVAFGTITTAAAALDIGLAAGGVAVDVGVMSSRQTTVQSEAAVVNATQSSIRVDGASVNSSITTRYSRPSNATTPAQRAFVQNRTCITCGQRAEKMNADHIDPLVKEYYRNGTIDLQKMRSLNAVQPQCPTCSARQGGGLSQFSQRVNKLLKL